VVESGLPGEGFAAVRTVRSRPIGLFQPTPGAMAGSQTGLPDTLSVPYLITTFRSGVLCIIPMWRNFFQRAVNRGT